MTVQMTESLQSIIIAVQNYRKWRYADLFARERYSASNCERIESETYGYYTQLRPEREGLDTTRVCLEAVLSYPIKETINTESEDLPKMFTFSW